MQFIDLRTQFERIEEDVVSRIESVLHGQQFIMGPEVRELEERLALYVGVKHAIACSSGTDALIISLMTLGLSKTDAVFVPSFTFFASAESISLAGGTPVFVDSDPKTFNISPSALEATIEKTLADGKLVPRGIIPVDLFGQPADYDAIDRIASKYGLFVLEDAAQSFGAKYKGRKTGSLGTIGTTSFFPAKPLGCYGDGGAIFTNDDDLAETIVSVRVHGQGIDKYDNVRLGVNGRLDSMQAAILLAKLEVFDDELLARNRVASLYSAGLSDVYETPVVASENTSVWAQYTLLAKDGRQRENVVNGMKERGLPVAVYYPIPVHLSTAYRDYGYSLGDLPICEDLANRVFSIPMHPYLSDEDAFRIITALKELSR